MRERILRLKATSGAGTDMAQELAVDTSQEFTMLVRLSRIMALFPRTRTMMLDGHLMYAIAKESWDELENAFLLEHLSER